MPDGVWAILSPIHSASSTRDMSGLINSIRSLATDILSGKTMDRTIGIMMVWVVPCSSERPGSFPGGGCDLWSNIAGCV